MLKGTREGIVSKIQPISIHGQLSLDVQFVFLDDATQQPQVARIGPEAVDPGIEVGDRVDVEYLLGVPTRITRAKRPA